MHRIMLNAHCFICFRLFFSLGPLHLLFEFSVALAFLNIELNSFKFESVQWMRFQCHHIELVYVELIHSSRIYGTRRLLRAFMCV